MSSLHEVPEDVRALTQLCGLELKEDVREAIVELVELDVVPTAIAQVLKSLVNKAKSTQQQAHRAAT